MAKAKKKKRREIRITDASDKVFSAVTARATKNKQSNGAAADCMLEIAINSGLFNNEL